MGKSSACNAGDRGSIPGSGRSPGEKKQQPTSALLPGKFHDGGTSQATVLGATESDTTERFCFRFLVV